MRILIAGGRDFSDYDMIYNELRDYSEGVKTVISGGARGADTLGERWAFDHKAEVEEYPALWEEYGRAAGPIRNQVMLDVGIPDLVVVFPGGEGSKDMVRKARKAGVQTLTPGWEV